MTENKKKQEQQPSLMFKIAYNAGNIILLIASIWVIVGFFVPPKWVLLVGYIIFIVGTLSNIAKSIYKIYITKGKKTTEFNNAVINLVLMCIVLALCIFLIVFYAVNL